VASLVETVSKISAQQDAHAAEDRETHLQIMQSIQDIANAALVAENKIRGVTRLRTN